MAETTAELRSRRDQVVDADLVELRVDTVRDPSAAGALAGRRTPVIFTCRPRWEGGFFDGSEDERRRLLLDAQKLGAEYVDLEWTAGFTDVLTARGGQGVVLSSHDFNGVPADLVDRAAAMRASGAEVVKLAITARRLTDCLTLRAIEPSSAAPVVLLAMGDAGLPTRVLASHFGSYWTYAGDATALGQLAASRLCEEFAFRKVSSRTAVYGVVGRPVLHSISPAMHNAAFRAVCIDSVYVPLQAADFDDFLSFAGALSIAGASITAPYKVEAFEHADESDAVSRRIRSVNTLRRDGHRWSACNTDVAGFLAPLQGAMRLRGKRATILGAGGAARAVAEALSAAGADVSISARNREHADAVAQLAKASVTAWPPPRRSWDLLVNATPVGTFPHVEATPLPGGGFDGDLVYDLVYNPHRTRLRRDAEAAGCRTIGGLDMLVAQAQQQFEWWTGARPSDRVMREAALAALAALARGA